GTRRWAAGAGGAGGRLRAASAGVAATFGATGRRWWQIFVGTWTRSCGRERPVLPP
nr:hypothetical protein [Tanacetum cinerariifolium]